MLLSDDTDDGSKKKSQKKKKRKGLEEEEEFPGVKGHCSDPEDNQEVCVGNEDQQQTGGQCGIAIYLPFTHSVSNNQAGGIQIMCLAALRT